MEKEGASFPPSNSVDTFWHWAKKKKATNLFDYMTSIGFGNVEKITHAEGLRGLPTTKNKKEKRRWRKLCECVVAVRIVQCSSNWSDTQTQFAYSWLSRNWRDQLTRQLSCFCRVCGIAYCASEEEEEEEEKGHVNSTASSAQDWLAGAKKKWQ